MMMYSFLRALLCWGMRRTGRLQVEVNIRLQGVRGWCVILVSGTSWEHQKKDVFNNARVKI